MTTNNGNYTVAVTDVNGCKATSASYPVLNLGLTNLYDIASVKIAPNPANDAFTLTVNSELIGTEYSITDLTGRGIISGNVNAVSTPISTSSLSSGVYLVSVSDGTSTITKRLAIAR